MSNYTPFFTVRDFVSDTVRSTWRYWRDQHHRVERVINALVLSRSLTVDRISRSLAGLGVEDILHALTDTVIQIAAVYGASICGCSLIGTAVGALFGGVGAVPGAVVGISAGVELGTIILWCWGIAELGKMILEVEPRLRDHYTAGFRLAWRNPGEYAATASHSYGYPSTENDEDAARHGARELSEGHVILILALLTAVLTLMTRNGKAGRNLIAKSKLGEKVAAWAEVGTEGKLAAIKRTLNPDYSALTKEYNPQKALKSAAKEGGETRQSSIETVKSGKPPKEEPKKPQTNHEKAEFGEAKAHKAMTGKGFEPIGTDGKYKPGKQGIDGVYKNPSPPPDYVITEVKYGSGSLDTLADGKTRQMSDAWLLDNNRLTNKIDYAETKKIRDALDENSVEKWLVKVDGNGKVSASLIDKNGYVIRGNAGKVSGFPIITE